MNHLPCFGETVSKLTSNFLAPNPPFLVRSLLTKAVAGSAELLVALSLCALKSRAQGPSGHHSWVPGRTDLRDAAPLAGASLVMMMMMLPLPLSADSAERGPEPLRGAGRGGGGVW